MCVLIAVNNWVIGLTGNWYSISVIFLTIGIFNLEQAVQHRDFKATRYIGKLKCFGRKQVIMGFKVTLYK